MVIALRSKPGFSENLYRFAAHLKCCDRDLSCMPLQFVCAVWASVCDSCQCFRLIGGVPRGVRSPHQAAAQYAHFRSLPVRCGGWHFEPVVVERPFNSLLEAKFAGVAESRKARLHCVGPFYDKAFTAKYS